MKMVCRTYSIDGNIIVGAPRAVRDISQYHVVCQSIFGVHKSTSLLDEWLKYRRLWNHARRIVLIPLIIINNGQEMTVIVDATVGMIRRKSSHCDGWSIVVHPKFCTSSELPKLVCVTKQKGYTLRTISK